MDYDGLQPDKYEPWNIVNSNTWMEPIYHMCILHFLAYPSVTPWVGVPTDIIPGVATQQIVMDYTRLRV